MKTDKTTKALLTLIALGLWANAVGPWIAPHNVEAQSDYLLRQIATNVNNIANGFCLNDTICD